MTQLREDPPRREDGRCARRGCRKRIPQATDRHRRYGGAALDMEPFCSTECAKTYFGTTSVFKEGEGVFSKAALGHGKED